MNMRTTIATIRAFMFIHRLMTININTIFFFSISSTIKLLSNSLIKSSILITLPYPLKIVYHIFTPHQLTLRRTTKLDKLSTHFYISSDALSASYYFPRRMLPPWELTSYSRMYGSDCVPVPLIICEFDLRYATGRTPKA